MSTLHAHILHACQQVYKHSERMLVDSTGKQAAILVQSRVVATRLLCELAGSETYNVNLVRTLGNKVTSELKKVKLQCKGDRPTM